MTDTKGALIGLAAIALTYILPRLPDRFFEGPPWYDRPRPDRTQPGPLQGEIVRGRPGRELDRRQP